MTIAKQSITLKLHGKAFDLKPQNASLAKVMKHLDSCPKDEIFPHEEMSKQCGFHRKFLTHNSRAPEFQPYSAIVNRLRYVGHPQAIAELKRQMDEL